MALGWLWWRAWFPADAVVAAALRGRRGTWRHGSSLCVASVALMALGWLWWLAWFPVDAVVAAAVCVAGVALGDMDRHFAWQAALMALAGSGGALGSQLTPWSPRLWHLATSTFSLRGRRGTWRHRPSLCVAGVALGDMDRHLRGRCGTWRHRPSLCAAGVALGDMDRHFAWQAWHLATWIVTLPGRCGTWQHRPSLSGRCGTWRHGSSP